MGMHRPGIVRILRDLVIVLASFIGWVGVHAHSAEVAHVVEELMADLLGDGISLGH
jgi:hypothetical protein